MPSFISTRSAAPSPAAAAPLKRHRTAFDFSTFQKQHKEAARTLATFSSIGDATVTAPQVAAGGHPTALGLEVVVATIRCSASDFGAGHVLGSIQPQQAQQQQEHHQQLQQRQQQQNQKKPPPCSRLRVGPSPAASRLPGLVVGPGQFGGKVGLLDALQPPELTKYLTVSEV